MPPNREQIDARHLARVRAGFMDAIGRRDGRAIKDFYDELRRLGLTAEQGPLGVGDVTKLLGEPKGIVPARPSMGESWSAPPQDPRDFKALVQKMTDRAADLEDSRIGPMSPTPSQLPQPREAGPYGGGFSTFPPRGYGYWEKGPGGRGVWVDQKPAKGMKEYQRVMKGLERVLKVGRDPVDPPGTMPPGRRVVTPPVAPELQRNYKLQDLYEKTGQRSFPGWLQLD